MDRCKKCGLLLSYPGANSSNENNGECDYCKNFVRKRFLGEKKLLDRISNEQRIGVTVSGGKDSIYIWNWLVSKLGADKVVALNHNKVKAVHWMASENIQNAKKILGSEVIIVNDFDFYPRFINNLEAYIKNPNPRILRAVLCAGCRYGISGRLFEEAAKYNIRTIVNGSSYLESVPFKSYIMKMGEDYSETKGLLLGLSENESFLTENNLVTIIKDQFHCHSLNLSGKKNENGIDYVDFFNYVENNPQQIKDTVMSKLKWQHPVESDWHFDCIVEEFKQFFYQNEYGYSEIDFKTSEMVRYGLVDVGEAIKTVEEENGKIIAGYGALKSKLSLYGYGNSTIEAFERIYNES